MDDICHLPQPAQQVIRRVSSALRSGCDAGRLHRWLDEQRTTAGSARLASLRVAICLHPRHRDLHAARSALGDMRCALRHERLPSEVLLGQEAHARLSGGVAFLLDQPDRALAHYREALALRLSASNLCNVIAAQIRLGERTEVQGCLAQVFASAPEAFTARVADRLRGDPDLAPARAWVPGLRAHSREAGSTASDSRSAPARR